MEKKKILMVCEAFGGGVFTYVSQLCNDMVDDFEVYLAYSLRPQTPKNYKEFLNQKVHLIKMKHVGVNGLINLKSDIAAIKELRQIEKNVKRNVFGTAVKMYFKRCSILAKIFRNRDREHRHMCWIAIHDGLSGRLGIHEVYRPGSQI